MKLQTFNKDKELKKLNFNKNKSNYIKLGTLVASVLVIIISVIYFTYSKFTLTDTFTTLETTVNTFIPADYLLYYYVDGVAVINKPSTRNYASVVTCDNGARGYYNQYTQSLSIEDATSSATRCTVNLTTIAAPYQDGSGASIPELYNGLIPVTYDDSNNIIVADTSTEWYNYNNHEWANAILIDSTTTKDKYVNSDGTYKSGTTVDIDDVLQMYVWVPRYKYKLFNVSGSNSSPQMIEVEFESTDTAKSSGTQNNEWLTHPAFTFGTTELNGIWVGKFESSNSTSDVKIIPNVSSLRLQTVSDMFNASRAIETNAKYGLSSYEVDTHMMKNMEWGAVAYLTNSKYGRYESTGSCIASGCEIWINNNSNFTTGCAGDSVSASRSSSCNQWNTSTGVNASTTGNIYGIYDMSGGAWEYVMGNMTDSSGAFYPSDSGLSQPDSKYYDSYTYGTSYNDYSRGHLGDATKEVLSDSSGGYAWNDDYVRFVTSSYPWFGRGGHFSVGTNAGVFYFDRYNGSSADSNRSWRVVLSSE